MAITVKVTDRDGKDSLQTVDEDPDRCPICHYSVKPKSLNRDLYLDLSQSVIERVFQCPRRSCSHVFIARYRLGGIYGGFQLNESVPFELIDSEWEPAIKEVSEDFCQIVNEAQKAERLGLKLVAGPGYRKALEFLIKDYACKLHAGEVEAIKKMELGACIRKYMVNPMVKDTAQRATWLGNDETHYLRKWEGKDLQDLKELLQLVITTIHSELLYHKMKRDMPEGKK
jgi:hypothetical protein